MKRIILIVAFGICRSVGQALAAEVHPAPAKLTTNSPPSANEPGSNNDGLEVEIRAATDASKASIKWASVTEKGIGDSTSEYAGDAWEIIASAPLDKNNDQTRIATFDGFANAFSLSASRIWTHQDTSKNFADRKGVSASVGYKNLTYVDAISFEEKKPSRTPFSAGGFYGFTVGSQATYLMFGGEYKREFEDQKVKSIVLPPDTNGQTFARTGPFGSPKRKEQFLFSVGVTHKIPKTKYAGGIKITYDFKSDDYGIDVPLMLTGDGKENRWTGGIQLGYGSKEHKFYAAVVVGAPFNIIPK